MDDDTPGYGQYCPISRAAEVLAERWTLLILRDLLCGVTRFNELARGNPGLSRTLLSKRLRGLERARIVEHTGDEFLLTEAGHGLRDIVFALGDWGARWQFGIPTEDELRPDLLLWWMHRRIDFTPIDKPRVVLSFAFDGHPGRYWNLNELQGSSVCTHDPGFGIDASIAGDLSTLYQVWLGRLTFERAVRSGQVRTTGPPAVVRRLPQMFQLSQIAGMVRSRTDV